jgi:uncharacterized protein YfkK (UPF0435 family)
MLPCKPMPEDIMEQLRMLDYFETYKIASLITRKNNLSFSEVQTVCKHLDKF